MSKVSRNQHNQNRGRHIDTPAEVRTESTGSRDVKALETIPDIVIPKRGDTIGGGLKFEAVELFAKKLSIRWDIPAAFFLAVAFAETDMGRNTKVPNDWTGVSLARSRTGCGSVPASFDVLGSIVHNTKPYDRLTTALRAGTIDLLEYADTFATAFRPNDADYKTRITEFIKQYKEV